MLRGLVLLDGEHVIGAVIDNAAAIAGLQAMASMVTMRQRAGLGKTFQNSPDGPEFIGLFFDGFLAENEALVGGEGGNEMQRLLALAAITAAPRSLAVEREEFEVYYQPLIVTLETGVICGFEALLRWHHPLRGIIVLPVRHVAVKEVSAAE